MSDVLERLERFYRECDRAEPPVRLKPAARLFQTACAGAAPLAAAFATAAAVLAMASALVSSDSAPSSVFPRTLESAGLSHADLSPAKPPAGSAGARILWRA